MCCCDGDCGGYHATPARKCPECASTRLLDERIDPEPDAGIAGGYVTVCLDCGAEVDEISDTEIKADAENFREAEATGN